MYSKETGCRSYGGAALPVETRFVVGWGIKLHHFVVYISLNATQLRLRRRESRRTAISEIRQYAVFIAVMMAKE